MEKLIDLLNSPIVIATLGAALLYGLNRLYASKPKWAKYEGSIISAIKFAEKSITDDTESKGMKRLDEALQFVVKVYESKHGASPSPNMKDELKEGIQIVHNSLESAGEHLTK
jgi:hypothetical protein